MVSAYIFDKPEQVVSQSTLDALGVFSYKLDADRYEEEGKLAILCQQRNYAHRSEITCSPKTLQNYDEMLGKFFTEHYHDFEEIRFILDGSGFFDVRDSDDVWIRIVVKKGDLIVLPAGIYHRFTLDDGKYLKAMRLFVATQKEPIWTPINRSIESDHAEVRKDYVTMQLKNEVSLLKKDVSELKRKFDEILDSNKK